MKTLKLAVAVLTLSCLNSRAAIDANLDPIFQKATTAAIGAATGYVAKKQLSLYTRNTAESRTLGKVGYFVPTAAITLAAVYAALNLLEGAGSDATKKLALASLAAVTTFVATQNEQEEDDVYQAYAAANEEKKK